MKIGILETGHLSDTLKAKYGRYPAFFERLVGPYLPEASFFTIAVVDGEVARTPSQADGWIITGSRSGAYDDEPWIPPLEGFLRDCLEQKVPVVGICFGHQILARAMGGRVEKSEKGWGFGIADYRLIHRPEWLKEIGETFSVPAIHQDQIITPPPGAHIFASSDFCPVAGLIYGEIDAPHAISIQPHPEMSAAFVADIAEERLRHIIAPEIVSAALETLKNPADQTAWGKTIAAFLKR
ncbi:MAG: type 1 glutamine amidotransferase [Rhodobacteraceae bacterium]|nr:type 1 glutamine amidotransferase [Paracoccaceae bacterium]